jgi:hypothetical protein
MKVFHMMKIEDKSAVAVPVGSEGGRSPSTLSIGHAPPLPTTAPAAEAASRVVQPKVGPLG